MEITVFWEGLKGVGWFVLGLIVLGMVLSPVFAYLQRIKLNGSAEEEISAMLSEPFKDYVERLLASCEREEKRARRLPKAGYEAAATSINERWVSSIKKLCETHREATQFALAQNGLDSEEPYLKIHISDPSARFAHSFQLKR